VCLRHNSRGTAIENKKTKKTCAITRAPLAADTDSKKSETYHIHYIKPRGGAAGGEVGGGEVGEGGEGGGG
jgi:hypothetical protein